MNMLERTKEALLDFLQNVDEKPAAIIMLNKQLRELRADPRRQEHLQLGTRNDPNRFAFEGVPIWQSRRISGPVVVMGDLLDGLRRQMYVRKQLHSSLVDSTPLSSDMVALQHDDPLIY